MIEKITKTVKHPLFSGSAVMVFGSLATSFINYLYHLVMGRMLGPSSYSVLAAIVSLLGLIGILPMSLGLVVTKYVASSDENGAKSFISYFYPKVWIAGALSTILLMLASPFLSVFLHIQQTILFYLGFAMFLFFIPSMFLRSSMQGLLKFNEYVLSFLGENGSKIILATVLVISGLKVGGAVVAWPVGSLVGLIAGILVLRRFVSKKSKGISLEVGPILKYAFPVLVFSLATGSMYSTDLLLVKHFFSPFNAGLYSALSFLGRIIFFGASPIAAVMFPLVSKHHARGEKYTQFLLYSLCATLLLSLGILFVYGFFPKLAISLLYGAGYLKAAPHLFLFGVFISIFTLSFLLINYFLAIGRVKVVILPTLAAILQVVGISMFHESLVEVISVSTLCSSFLFLGLVVYYILCSHSP